MLLLNPYRFGGGGGGIPSVLLMHFDGTDGSTTFTDEYGHTVTPSGNAQIDTAQSKFGGASGLFDGTGDYLSIPTSTEWDFGTGDFTIEMWVRLASVTGSHRVIWRDNGANATSIGLFQNGADLEFYSSSDGSAWNICNGLSFGTFSINTFYFIAVTRSGTTFRTFKDGVLANSTTSSASLYVNSGALLVGAFNSGSQGYNGHIDDLRITKGTARYTANFTPPSAAFTE
jgi:hypothetical protein